MAVDPWDQVLLDAGYISCRPCDEFHRPPECCVDGEGRALAWCGCPWVVVESGGCECLTT